MAKHRIAIWSFLFTTASIWAWASTTPPNLDRALAAQYQVVSERPADAVALNDLGNLLLLADRIEEAESAYLRAKELDPTNSDVRFNLALLLHQNGMTGKAETELSELVEIDPEHAWARYQLGVVNSELGNRKAALEAYARAFALDPTLTFARNNPHILDNELATEALLLSGRYRESVSSRIPRRYGDAERIADLMLEPDVDPSSASTEAGAPDEETPRVEESMDPEDTSRPRSLHHGGDARFEPSEEGGPIADGGYDQGGYDSEGEAVGARRQLTNEDLEESSSGSRSRGGVAGGYYRPANPSARSSEDGRGITPRTRRPVARSDGRSAGRPATGPDEGRSASGSAARPGGSTVVIPGRSSSGRSGSVGGSGGGQGGSGFQPSRPSSARLTFDLLLPPADPSRALSYEEEAGP